MAPLLSRLSHRLGSALQFLLVQLLGRSLGLIYRGILESLKLPRGRRDDEGWLQTGGGGH